MPVCYHKRQNLTTLASEDDLSLHWSHVLLSEKYFPCSLFSLTSFILSFSAASDLSLQFAQAYLSQYLGSILIPASFICISDE